MQIMDTDYDNYTLVYNCEDSVKPVLLIGARTTSLDQDIVDKLKDMGNKEFPGVKWLTH